MSSESLETLIARLLVDAQLRAQFLDDPKPVFEACALDADERAALLEIDRPGLCLAARSIAAKHARRRRGWLERTLARIRDARPGSIRERR
jgi:hypothetical protein